MIKPQVLHPKQGVEIWWLPTNQFSVLRLEFNFVTPQRYQNTTQRRLLANLLQRSSAVYPTQAQLARKLSILYGTEINGKTTIFQNLNLLSLSLTTPDNDMTKAFVDSALAVLFQLIQQPNLNADGSLFDSKALALERTNLRNLYHSLQDNYALRASLQLQQLLAQARPELKVPAFGNEQQLDLIQNHQLVEQYQQLLQQDQLIITVVGDYQAKIVPMLAEQLTFLKPAQQSIVLEDLTLPARAQILSAQNVENIQQSQLVLAYQLTAQHSKNVWRILNMMLGGDDQSLLFQEVREKNGMAYSIYSNLNFTQGILKIQAGVDEAKLSVVKDLVAQQLEQLQTKDLVHLFSHAQLVLINQRLIDSDSVDQQADRLLLKALKPQAVLDDDQFILAIQQVTFPQVQQAAADLKFYAQYQLIGAKP
ncbi:insulinase family protein [Bombilactobacillus folatiphilus]|uniref:Insulinase family protein n=1 Tax=Bombilactobacillus folatiphilus TaxID=2923362 RepID=A0ABY4P7N9_9LACO|nr:insulinase family protein [Bombilactobacillus folatiphilus]UQS81709.1 insulinase family protein [Bombilactobacillus folatiphilus]